MKVNSIVITKDGLPAIIRKIKDRVTVSLFTIGVRKIVDIDSIREITKSESYKLSYVDGFPNLLTINQNNLINHIRGGS